MPSFLNLMHKQTKNTMNNDTKIIMVAVISGLAVYFYMRNKQDKPQAVKEQKSSTPSGPVGQVTQNPVYVTNPSFYPYYFYPYSAPNNINVSVSPTK